MHSIIHAHIQIEALRRTRNLGEKQIAGWNFLAARSNSGIDFSHQKFTPSSLSSFGSLDGFTFFDGGFLASGPKSLSLLPQKSLFVTSCFSASFSFEALKQTHSLFNPNQILLPKDQNHIRPKTPTQHSTTKSLSSLLAVRPSAGPGPGNPYSPNMSLNCKIYAGSATTTTACSSIPGLYFYSAAL